MPLFLGNCIIPPVMSRAGRRAAHFLVILVTVISWIIVILAPNYETLLVSMVLQGAATGRMSPLRSILIGECTSPLYRGAFLTMNALAQTVGILLVHLIGSFISYKMTALESNQHISSKQMNCQTFKNYIWQQFTFDVDDICYVERIELFMLIVNIEAIIMGITYKSGERELLFRMLSNFEAVKHREEAIMDEKQRCLQCIKSLTGLSYTGSQIKQIKLLVQTYNSQTLVSMSFCIVSLLITIYTPDTPSSYAMRGQYDKCRESFMWFRRPEDLPELGVLIDTSRYLGSKKHNLKEILVFAMRKEFYKPIILMSALFSITNFSDGTLLVVFPIPILQALLGPTANAAAWMVALDAQDLVFTTIAVYVVHKVKRRTLLFTAGVICLVSQSGMAVYMLAVTNGWLSHITWVVGVLICLEMSCVHIGLLPLCSVVAGEVFPLQFRSYSESISLLTSYGPVFLLLKAFPDLMNLAGLHGVFGLYAGVIFLSLVVAWFLLPETSSLTLQQIEDHFKGAPLLEARTDEGIPLKGSDLEGRLRE